jgi:hypothetical protein
MKTDTVYIYDGQGNDISNDVELTDRRSNPFGWNTCTLRYKGEIIGYQTSGNFSLKEPYTHKIIEGSNEIPENQEAEETP